MSLALVAVVVAIQSGRGALLIPRFGGVGIAAATAVAMLVGLAGAQVALVRQVRRRDRRRDRAPHARGAAAAGLVVHLLLELPHDPRAARPPHGIALASVSVVTVVVFPPRPTLFVALLFLTGGLGREDANRFKRVFARAKPSTKDAQRP